MVHFFPAVRLQKGDIFIQLTPHVTPGLIGKFGVDHGGIQDKEGNVEEPCLDLIPFQHRAADVVAAHQHVRFRQSPDGAAVDRGAGDIGPGVGAEVAGIPHGFRFFAQVHTHFRRPDHGTVVFRVHRDHVHGDERFHGAAAGDPGDFFPGRIGRLGFYIVGGHDLFHPPDTPDLFSFHVWVSALFRNGHLFSPRVLQCRK